MKKLWLLLIVALILTGCLPKKTTTSSGGETSQLEEFTGSLLDAFKRNLPMKCEWKNNDNQATAYIHGQKMFLESVYGERTGYVIQKDDCFWSWNKDEGAGMKVCYEPSEMEAAPGEGVEPGEASFQGVNWETSYKCAPAVFGDDRFNPPSEVKFSSIEEMMQQGLPGVQ